MGKEMPEGELNTDGAGSGGESGTAFHGVAGRAARNVKRAAADAARGIQQDMMDDGRFSVADVTRMGDLANEYGRQAAEGGTRGGPGHPGAGTKK
jgi:hypothetical protein